MGRPGKGRPPAKGKPTGKGKAKPAEREEKPPQATLAIVDAATLDAKLNNVRAAWTEVEARRAKRKIELKDFADRIAAASEQRDMLLRNDTTEQATLVLDQARTLQLRIDKLEGQRETCASRWKEKIDEAEQAFRDQLFGEQLPLLLTAGESPPGEEVAPANADAQVVELELGDGRLLKVGARVMIHGAGAHRPGVILELENRGKEKHHAALVRYDEGPTPSHVMAHQLHPLDIASGDEDDDDEKPPEPAPRVSKREAKKAAAGRELARQLGHVELAGPAPAGAPLKRGSKPPELGDRVHVIDPTGAAVLGRVGTIERTLNDGYVQVRWDGDDDRLHDHELSMLRKAKKGAKGHTPEPSIMMPIDDVDEGEDDDGFEDTPELDDVDQLAAARMPEVFGPDSPTPLVGKRARASIPDEPA